VHKRQWASGYGGNFGEGSMADCELDFRRWRKKGRAIRRLNKVERKLLQTPKHPSGAKARDKFFYGFAARLKVVPFQNSENTEILRSL
jgi:hypothetical protein